MISHKLCMHFCSVALDSAKSQACTCSGTRAAMLDATIKLLTRYYCYYDHDDDYYFDFHFNLRLLLLLLLLLQLQLLLRPTSTTTTATTMATTITTPNTAATRTTMRPRLVPPVPSPLLCITMIIADSCRTGYYNRGAGCASTIELCWCCWHLELGRRQRNPKLSRQPCQPEFLSFQP